MQNKRFLALMAALLVLGAIALVGLYVMLRHFHAALAHHFSQ